MSAASRDTDCEPKMAVLAHANGEGCGLSEMDERQHKSAVTQQLRGLHWPSRQLRLQQHFRIRLQQPGPQLLSYRLRYTDFQGISPSSRLAAPCLECALTDIDSKGLRCSQLQDCAFKAIAGPFMLSTMISPSRVCDLRECSILIGVQRYLRRLRLGCCGYRGAADMGSSG